MKEMKTYILPIETFLTLKSVLDQTVFWRMHDEDNVEIKPIFPSAKEYFEKILNKEERGIEMKK
jgi:hypothetical protein